MLVRPVLLALALSMIGAGPSMAASVAQLGGRAGCIGDSAGCARGVGFDGTDGAAVTPDGRNLYVVANDGEFGALLSLARDRASGVLRQLPGAAGCSSSNGRAGAEDSSATACHREPTLARASDVAVSPDSRTVYTVGSEDFVEALDVWRRDAATGELTLVQCLTAQPRAGCAEAPFIEPRAIALSPDGRRLTVGGGSLGSFAVGDDGTVGAGHCDFRLGRSTGGVRTACATAPVYARRLQVSSLKTAAAGTGARVFAEVDSAFAGGSARQLAVFNYDGGTGAYTAAQCRGGAREVGACGAMRAFGRPPAIAVSPDGSSVYSAGTDFVVTNEEDSTGFVRGSAISAFTESLRQLGHRAGCVLFTGRRNPGCGTRPRRRRRAFTSASAVAVTPDGRHLLGGFSRSVALLGRNRRTGALVPVGGSRGCVDERRPRVARCRRGHRLGFPRAFAFSPDGRFAYVTTGEAVVTLRLRA